MFNIIRSAANIAKDGIMIAVTTVAMIGVMTGRATGTVRTTGRITDLIISRSSAIIVRHRRVITVRHRFTAPAVMPISTGATTVTGLTAHRTIHSSRITVRADSATPLISEQALLTETKTPPETGGVLLDTLRPIVRTKPALTF